MRLFTYVVARDYGFAPNPFGGVCTLATCKPDIRRGAQVGDWVAGIASKADKEIPSLTYAMQVAETLSYDAYWRDPRFFHKKPEYHASVRHVFGDNIYSKDSNGRWLQADSHHSLDHGVINFRNVANDTKADKVLIGSRFAYWGADAIPIPAEFCGAGSETIMLGIGFRSNFSDVFVQSFVQWLHSLKEQGCIGEPAQWKKPRAGWAGPRPQWT